MNPSSCNVGSMKLIQVPARVEKTLVAEVRKKMLGENLKWAILIRALFRAYLDGKITISVDVAVE